MNILIWISRGIREIVSTAFNSSRLEIDAIDVDEKSKRDKFERMEQVNESGIIR